MGYCFSLGRIGSGIRCVDVITKYHQWTELSEILNTEASSLNWAALGDELGYNERKLRNFGLSSDPTKELLSNWFPTQDATIDNLLVALQAIQQFEVYHIVIEWLEQFTNNNNNPDNDL